MKIDECTKAGCSGPGIVKTNQDAYFVKENFLKIVNIIILEYVMGMVNKDMLYQIM